MKYHCTGCDYIYDELKGDSEEGIEPFTYFDDLPSDFFCPYCEMHKDDFVLLSQEINIPLDVYHLTQLEALHFPEYTIENDVLTFQIEHPNEKDHFIYKVSLHDESGEMIEEKKYILGEDVEGKFDIEYLDEIELRVFCSKEGIYSTGIIVV